MSPTRLADAVTTHTTVVIVSLLALTLVLGAGITAVEYDTSLDQFESQTPETETLEYATENFTTRDEANTTITAVIISGDDVLSKESLLDSLALQRQLYDDGTVEATLTEEAPIVGVENVVATTVIREREADDLRERGADLRERGQRLNETAESLDAHLEETRKLQVEYERLNTSYEAGEIDRETYRSDAEEIEADLEAVRDRATADLEDDQARSFERAIASVRSVQAEVNATERALANGSIERDTYDQRMDRLEDGLEAAYTDGTVGVLSDEYDQLWDERQRLEAERDALESTDPPPLSEQVDALESLNESAYERHLESAFAGESEVAELAAPLFPSAHEPGSLEADERLLLVRQQSPDDGIEDSLVESQLAIQRLADDHGEGIEDDYAVFGFGLVAEEIDRAIVDSLWLVGPLALGVVLTSLTIAYRDPLEVALGVVGIVTVLVWTFGFLGWAGIAFNQLFVAIPVLLIGLSIDYAIHVFMRHRECRDGGTHSVRSAMTLALAGVGGALVWVTATTAIGFLANLVSPVAPLREFGLVSTVGIVAALLVFGCLMPALKVELEEFLEARGIDRRKAAFGTGEGRLSGALSIGSKAAWTAPVVVLVLVFAVTAGSLYAAGSVDTNFQEEDFLADEPGWADGLAVSPDREYRAKAAFDTLDERFDYRGSQAQIVVTGDVTDGETLQRIDAARAQAEGANSTDAPPTAAAGDRDPLSVMESVAREDESFNASFRLADRTGDGVPDQNLEGLYDGLFEADPETASAVVHRTDDGEYEAVRMLVSVSGDDGETLTAEMREAAATIDDDGADERWEATATGEPIADHVVERHLLTAILESFAVALAVVFTFLALAYALMGNGATLGLVTLLPVALVVPWTVGTLALLELPLNILTGTVASLTIGLGVAYNVHVSSRYTLELRRRGNAREALEHTMTGTGGALLGSVATTTLGFATLALATLPAVRQFGLVTAMTIAYAFLASVLVLPTLLVLWTRYAGPDRLETGASTSRHPSAEDD
ncbi:MMPL family transporter [Natrialbaceae archaeon A-gly3]